jgi:hypothetical protein
MMDAATYLLDPQLQRSRIDSGDKNEDKLSDFLRVMS